MNKIDYLLKKIHQESSKKYSFMEVCGTHTMSIASHAIKSLLPENIKLISGPGCPVCVTSQNDIELSLILARMDDTIIATFGDMIRVPSLDDKLENYKNVSIVYSPTEALELAKNNASKEIVFLAVGFETTNPTIACTIKMAEQEQLKNFSILSMNKTIPQVLKDILSNTSNSINGLILPGHISVLTGSDYFNFLADYNMYGVVSGFEALEILESIYLLIQMNDKRQFGVVNNYQNVVENKGNKEATTLVNEVFESKDCHWRGLGIVKGSALEIRKAYELFDAKKRFHLIPQHIQEEENCLCGKILMGEKSPIQCINFGSLCTPLSPLGPCMVSSEGTCSARYKYG